MTKPCVLILEAAGPESGALVATATTAGYLVHAVTQADQHANYSADLCDMLAGCLLTNFSRSDQALDEIIEYARRISADAVLTTSEYLTPLLAMVCDALGLPGNDPARADAARDKIVMSEMFARYGVTTPRTHVVDDEDGLGQLLADSQITFPKVVKPAHGAGSAGVTVVHDPHGCLPAWRAADGVRDMYGSPHDPRVLVKDYVTGTEYSVESFTRQGISTQMCTTAKIVTSGAHRVELGHSVPALLSPSVERAVHEQVDRAIAATGIRNGASHTEVIVGADGRCTVIEIGARLGAGHIGVLMQHALGIDPWAALLDIALGRPADLTRTRNAHAAVRFLTSPCSGRLRAVSGLPQPNPNVPDVRLRRKVGDVVEEARSNRERLGHIVVTGKDQAAVEQETRRLLATVTIDVDPVSDEDGTISLPTTSQAER